jgi:hypothetical protein
MVSRTAEQRVFIVTTFLNVKLPCCYKELTSILMFVILLQEILY